MILQEGNTGVLIDQKLRKVSPVAQYILEPEFQKIDAVQPVPTPKLRLLVKESWNKTRCAWWLPMLVG